VRLAQARRVKWFGHHPALLTGSCMLWRHGTCDHRRRMWCAVCDRSDGSLARRAHPHLVVPYVDLAIVKVGENPARVPRGHIGDVDRHARQNGVSSRTEQSCAWYTAEIQYSRQIMYSD
jgi:hypothetical protein